MVIAEIHLFRLCLFFVMFNEVEEYCLGVPKMGNKADRGTKKNWYSIEFRLKNGVRTVECLKISMLCVNLD